MEEGGRDSASARPGQSPDDRQTTVGVAAFVRPKRPRIDAVLCGPIIWYGIGFETPHAEPRLAKDFFA